MLFQGSVQVLNDRLHHKLIEWIVEVDERWFGRKFELRRIHVYRFDLKARLLWGFDRF